MKEEEREVRTTCDNCGCNLYEGDDYYWRNSQIGTHCEKCAEADDETAEVWGEEYE